MKQKDLSPQHTQFINEYFANSMNATQAYLATYPNSSYETACANASKLLSNANIQIAVQKKFAELQAQSNTTILDITDKLNKIIEQSEQKQDHSTTLKALDLLAKLLGAYAPKRIEQTNTAPVQINIIAPIGYVPPNGNLLS